MGRNIHGDFIWYELITPDAAAAERFYGRVLGWTAATPPGGMERGYRVFSAAGQGVGGVLEMQDCKAGSAKLPGWLGYVGVDDVDASAARVVAEGGRQMMAPQDIPGVGRFAFLADPQGVPFYVMRGLPDQPSTAFSPDAVGHCNWNELAVPDPARGLEFWHRHFGWTKSGAMPMGEMGDYEFLDHGGRTIGALLPTMSGRPPSFLFYFGVADIDRAAAAVTEGGGAIAHGPSEIPGGRFILVATDPQGAWFALVGPRA